MQAAAIAEEMGQIKYGFLKLIREGKRGMAKAGDPKEH
jgi:hypothetical protein